MDLFCPTGKVSKKRVHLLRWTPFPGWTGWNFCWMDRAKREWICNKERIFRVIFFSLRLISLSVSLVQWCLLTWRNGKLWRQSGRFHTQPGDTVQKPQSPGSYQGTGWQHWAPPLRPEVQPIDALKRTFLVFWEDNFCLKCSLNQCPTRSGW